MERRVSEKRDLGPASCPHLRVCTLVWRSRDESERSGESQSRVLHAWFSIREVGWRCPAVLPSNVKCLLDLILIDSLKPGGMKKMQACLYILLRYVEYGLKFGTSLQVNSPKLGANHSHVKS